MKIGQSVTSNLFTKGKILESHGAEFLVEHEINTDGRAKKIQQWYNFEVLTGIPNEEEVADKKIVLSDVSEATKVNGDIIGEALKSVELGIDIAKGKDNTIYTRGNKSKVKVELGVTPENEEVREEK
jgi:hypothetical protein